MKLRVKKIYIGSHDVNVMIDRGVLTKKEMHWPNSGTPSGHYDIRYGIVCLVENPNTNEYYFTMTLGFTILGDFMSFIRLLERDNIKYRSEIYTI